MLRMPLFLTLGALVLAGCATPQESMEPLANVTPTPPANESDGWGLAPPIASNLCLEGEPDCDDAVGLP